MSVEQNLSIAAILLFKTNVVLEGLKGTKEEVEKPEGLPSGAPRLLFQMIIISTLPGIRPLPSGVGRPLGSWGTGGRSSDQWGLAYLSGTLV